MSQPSDSVRRGIRSHPIALWIAFAVVHAVVGYLVPTAPWFNPSDVQLVYLPWAQLAAEGHVVGIESNWVYPIGALVPIMLPLLLGVKFYYLGWFLLVTALDAVAFGALIGGGHPRRLTAAWWWLLFIALLGPVGLARLDAISVPLVILGLLWLAARERLASAVLAAALWIKVWPAAVIGALIIGTRHRLRVIEGSVAVSIVIAILVVTFGGGAHLFGFIGAQTSRGLQIEAPIAVPWLWMASVGVPNTAIYYDHDLLTYQIRGASVQLASDIMTPVLAVAALAVVVLGLRAVLRRSTPVRMLPPLVLAIVILLIAFNKVGSPQYFDWLAPAIVLGIVYQGRRFVTPAVLVAVAGILTQIIYPWFYDQVLAVQPWALAVLTARNLIEFAVFGWAVVALWRSAAVPDASLVDPDPHAEPVWPFDRSWWPGTASPTPTSEAAPAPTTAAAPAPTPAPQEEIS